MAGEIARIAAAFEAAVLWPALARLGWNGELVFGEMSTYFAGVLRTPKGAARAVREAAILRDNHFAAMLRSDMDTPDAVDAWWRNVRDVAHALPFGPREVFAAASVHAGAREADAALLAACYAWRTLAAAGTAVLNATAESAFTKALEDFRPHTIRVVAFMATGTSDAVAEVAVAMLSSSMPLDTLSNVSFGAGTERSESIDVFVLNALAGNPSTLADAIDSVALSFEQADMITESESIDMGA